MRSYYRHIIWLLLMLMFYNLRAEEKEKGLSPYRFNELTVFVIPSPVPFDWSSPATLSTTFLKGYFSRMLYKERYLLGHLFVQLTTPMLVEPLIAGMRSVSSQEQRVQLLKERPGLGILGIGFEGRLETGEELLHKIPIYKRRKELASVTFRLNDEATRLIIDFIKRFDRPSNEGIRPSGHYGGAFWPLYRNEGAGCTAFGLAMLELAGICEMIQSEWKVSVNIPLHLIGGELNPGNEVRIRNIRSTAEWAGECHTESFVPFYIYDPNLIYTWIKERVSTPQSPFFDASQGKMPALYVDFRNVEPRIQKFQFSERLEENLFINHHRSKLGIFSSDYADD